MTPAPCRRSPPDIQSCSSTAPDVVQLLGARVRLSLLLERRQAARRGALLMPLALAHRHSLDAGKKQIEAEGEVGIRVHALAQGRRGLHKPRVAFGWQRLQEEPGTPPGVKQLP